MTMPHDTRRRWPRQGCRCCSAASSSLINASWPTVIFRLAVVRSKNSDRSISGNSILPTGVRRPFHRERVALEGGGVAIALERPSVDDLAAFLLDRFQRQERAGWFQAGLFFKFPLGRRHQIFVGVEFALGNRPDAFISVDAKGAAGMGQQNFSGSLSDPIHQQSGTKSWHIQLRLFDDLLQRLYHLFPDPLAELTAEGRNPEQQRECRIEILRLETSSRKIVQAVALVVAMVSSENEPQLGPNLVAKEFSARHTDESPRSYVAGRGTIDQPTANRPTARPVPGNLHIRPLRCPPDSPPDTPCRLRGLAADVAN